MDVYLCPTFSPVTWSGCLCVPLSSAWHGVNVTWSGCLCIPISALWHGADVCVFHFLLCNMEQMSVCSTFFPLTWSGYLCVPPSAQWLGADSCRDRGQVWDADSFLLAVPVGSHHRFYQGLEAVPSHAFCQPLAGHFIWLHDQSECDPICWPFHLASWSKWVWPDLLAISFGFMIKVSMTRSAGHFIWLYDQSVYVTGSAAHLIY